jgi:endonuclease/exonuclease/phosphatase family metal-dependent hydrolase
VIARWLFVPSAWSRARGTALLLCAGFASSCALVENYDDPDGPRYFAHFAPPLDADDQALETLVVCTFNIEFAEHVEAAIDELRDDENLQRCTALLLQEMDWPGARQVAEALALDVVYYPGSVHHGKDFGNAVLSRWPIVDDEKLILPHRNPTNGRIRIAVNATLDAPFARVTAYSVHGDTPWLGPAARLDQAEAIAADTARFDWPVVVGGDFNTSDPGSVERTVDVFVTRDFAWATREVPPSADGPLGAKAIDHVFAKGFSVTAAGTVSTRASDHQPIWVELRPLL